MGLIAASLENLQEDARETYGRLGDLYRAAIQVDIDPGPYFQQAAELSSTEVKNISHESMQTLLANFQQSPYFEKELKPKLSP